MADRVRYYLEQLAPELQDLERLGLFDKKELAIIMRKRTAFEHRITGRASKPKDFLRYAEYEMNAEALRKKRVSRLGVKNSKKGPSEGAGPRRINFIFERAVRKYPTDMALWMHYIDYAKSQKQVNVINKIFTKLLQLHPTNPSVWMMAAKYESEENASIKAARSIMQRGLRFNRESGKMWLEYAKLELLYISKLLARRKLLGIKSNIEEKEASATADETEIALPELSERDLNESLNQLPEADFKKLGDLTANAALKGDVALTVFDEAVTQVRDPMSLCVQFLELFDSFKDLDRQYLCNHVIEYLAKNHPSDKTKILQITLPLRHVSSVQSRRFPDQLKLVVTNFNNEQEKSAELKQLFRERVIQEYLAQDVDENIKKVLEIVDKKL